MSKEFTPEQMRFLHASDPQIRKIVEVFEQKGIKLTLTVHPMAPPLPKNVISIKRAVLKRIK